MEAMKNAINWFEIPATDFDRAIRFYSAIYGNDMPTRDMGHIKMGYFAIIQDTEGNHIYLHSMS